MIAILERPDEALGLAEPVAVSCPTPDSNAPEVIWMKVAGVGRILLKLNVYTVEPDSVLEVDAPGVLRGAWTASGDSLQTRPHATGVMPGAMLGLRKDGSFRYLPAKGFVGVDSFAYWAKDGSHARVGYVAIIVR